MVRGAKALLTSTAVLVTSVAAQAADLPSRKAAPAQFVRICSGYGEGFFMIPGTDTCLKVGGYVRFDAQYTPGQAITNLANGAISQVASAQDTSGVEVRGGIALDARTASPYRAVQRSLLSGRFVAS